MKYVIAVLIMGLLSACSAGASSPSEQPLQSVGQPESMAPSETDSTPPSTSPAGAAESPAASGMTSQACEDAWQAVDAGSVETIGDLVVLGDQLRPTFDDCSSVVDWQNAASAALPMLSPGDLESWASGQCALDDAIGETPVCSDFAA